MKLSPPEYGMQTFLKANMIVAAALRITKLQLYASLLIHLFHNIIF